MSSREHAPRSREIESALRRLGVGEVRTDSLTLGAYSSDASLYRILPSAVVMPRDADEVAATLHACAELGVPLTSRGAGTSVAGNAVGPGVVLDFSRHMNRVLDLDPEARTARVEPGAIHADLQRRATGVGLRFGPDPSTHTRCTIGGMIGNNACGARTLGYGRTSDSVVGLRFLTGTGETLRTTAPSGGRPTTTGAKQAVEALRRLTGDNLAVIRTSFATFGRQVSGYALEHLLPENRFDLGRALVGSEGTLGIVTEATVGLVRDPAHRVMVVLGYPDISSAGEAAPAVLGHRPTACEGIDSRIVNVVRERRGPGSVPPLPDGRAWLFVELVGSTAEEAASAAERLRADMDCLDHMIVTDPARAGALWRIREDGAGLSGRAQSGKPAYAGWEDAAVPPAVLGAYLRDFDELLLDFGLTGMPFGHFGEGCVHVRLDFPLDRPGGPARFREFLTAAARLVARYGGSLSGEHGDGRARSELLPLMYPPEVIGLFAQVKRILDPANLLNPGVLVDPDPVDARLRVAQAPPLRTGLALAYAHDGGDFGQAVHRCTGVGKCRADNTASGGVMCPSYLATREEKDSTRGRARILQEMVNGDAVTGGWRSPEVHEALDLCLSCKGCASDCPTGIDMAAYKAEVLHQSYRRRLRPAAHYSLGWLPRWARLAGIAPRLVNRLIRVRGIAPLALRLAGVDPRRSLPEFAPRTFRRWFADTADQRVQGGKPVVLFVDSFTDHFSPEAGRATVLVLEAAGYSPTITDQKVCCGLTWISTGQLTAARRILGTAVDALAGPARQGVPIVGVEPSCTGVLRGDAVELLASGAAAEVAAATRTLAELLGADPDWRPPRLEGVSVVAQPHCHHHAVMGWSPDAELLQEAGAEIRRLGGCCGLAGNFGVERGHYEVSLAVAGQQLLPAVEAAAPETVILADGFSCRTQLSDLTDRKGVHLAQLLKEHLDGAGNTGRDRSPTGRKP
ncbi:FAD-binding and (Fe-S)-binding domain-containing protein [Nocardiopsis ansamitocini]|nr:FAD-binding and (Fe-S)-binding domain-containing protein [Nocardiopsis ansamitocini]